MGGPNLMTGPLKELSQAGDQGEVRDRSMRRDFLCHCWLRDRRRTCDEECEVPLEVESGP